jgi:hypothetical protein
VGPSPALRLLDRDLHAAPRWRFFNAKASDAA